MLTSKLKLIFVIILLACGLQGCQQQDKEFYLPSKSYQVPDPAKHLVLFNVYSYQQTTNYTCGPAAVMTLMHHYGMLSDSDMNSTTEMRIAGEMGTTEGGTSQMRMVEWLRNNGFNVSYGENVGVDTLIDNLKRSIPTLIVWNDFSGHSLLVVGYDSEGTTPNDRKDKLFVADPSTSSYITEKGQTLYGIDTLSPSQITLNEMTSSNSFNPSHNAVGMYIVATPKK